MDVVRVLRVVEYVGPRNLVEAQVENSIHKVKKVSLRGLGAITIRAATIGTYPEILEEKKEDKECEEKASN